MSTTHEFIRGLEVKNRKPKLTRLSEAVIR